MSCGYISIGLSIAQYNIPDFILNLKKHDWIPYNDTCGEGATDQLKKVQKDSHTSLTGTLYAGKISFVHDYDKKRFLDNYTWRKQFLRSLHKEKYCKVFFFLSF